MQLWSGNEKSFDLRKLRLMRFWLKRIHLCHCGCIYNHQCREYTEVAKGHSPAEIQYISLTTEKCPFTKTFCSLFVRKLIIHNTMRFFKPKFERSLCAKRCGCMVLKADEKPANKILAWVWSPSRYLYRVFKMNSLASSTPLPGLNAIEEDPDSTQ